MVGIWWKNNVKYLPRVQKHLTAFMFWEICICIPVMNTQLYGTSNYRVLIYYNPNAYPLFHETSLVLSLLYITAWMCFTVKKLTVWNVIYTMNWFRHVLNYTATCSQPLLFLGKSLVMIWDNSQTAASFCLTRNPYIIWTLASIFPNCTLIVRNPWDAVTKWSSDNLLSFNIVL